MDQLQGLQVKNRLRRIRFRDLDGIGKHLEGQLPRLHVLHGGRRHRHFHFADRYRPASPILIIAPQRRRTGDGIIDKRQFHHLPGMFDRPGAQPHLADIAQRGGDQRKRQRSAHGQNGERHQHLQEGESRLALHGSLSSVAARTRAAPVMASVTTFSVAPVFRSQQELGIIRTAVGQKTDQQLAIRYRNSRTRCQFQSHIPGQSQGPRAVPHVVRNRQFLGLAVDLHHHDLLLRYGSLPGKSQGTDHVPPHGAQVEGSSAPQQGRVRQYGNQAHHHQDQGQFQERETADT